MIDWSSSNDISAMLAVLPDGGFYTELRLFSVACASRVLRFLPEPAFEQALNTSKRFASDENILSDLQQIVESACELLDPHVDVPTIRATSQV